MTAADRRKVKLQLQRWKREGIAQLQRAIREAKRAVRVLEQRLAAVRKQKIPRVRSWYVVLDEGGRVRSVHEKPSVAKRRAGERGEVVAVHGIDKPRRGASVGAAAPRGLRRPGVVIERSSAARKRDEPMSLQAFADKVHRTMRTAENWHGDRVWIDSVYSRGFASMDRAAFNKQLLAAHRAGLVRLARADLVQAMPRKHVDASEIRHIGGITYHFIATE